MSPLKSLWKCPHVCVSGVYTELATTLAKLQSARVLLLVESVCFA